MCAHVCVWVGRCKCRYLWRLLEGIESAWATDTHGCEMHNWRAGNQMCTLGKSRKYSCLWSHLFSPTNRAFKTCWWQVYAQCSPTALEDFSNTILALVLSEGVLEVESGLKEFKWLEKAVNPAFEAIGLRVSPAHSHSFYHISFLICVSATGTGKGQVFLSAHKDSITIKNYLPRA